MCVMSVFFSCNDDDDDENNEPNFAYRSIWRQEQHKEFQARLPSEILAWLNDAFSRNPASDQTGPNGFAASGPIDPNVTAANTTQDSLEKPQPL